MGSGMKKKDLVGREVVDFSGHDQAGSKEGTEVKGRGAWLPVQTLHNFEHLLSPLWCSVPHLCVYCRYKTEILSNWAFL